jgi:pimeloyl-ACP methyl ester carboxylesterase
VGLVGGLLGVVAVGAGVGLAAERMAVGRTRLRPDPEADEPFFRLPADRSSTVRASDGVALHVEQTGPRDAPLTVVFSHGYTQQMAVWHYQRKALSGETDVRCVFWDQRSHGRSARSDASHETIDQLGRDLHAVLDAVVPTGPVVLVGHSMGGMTVMALADSAPELFGPRVVAVGLIGTSTGRLAELTFGLPAALAPITRRTLPWLTRGMARRPGPFERSRRLGTDLAFLVARQYAFGDGDVSPAVVEFVEKMTAATRVDVIAEFYDTFSSHDKLAALDVLRGVATLVLVGSKDRITPLGHSVAIAEALPTAELVVLEGAGHMVQLERADEVTAHVRRLLDRAATTARSA